MENDGREGARDASYLETWMSSDCTWTHERGRPAVTNLETCQVGDLARRLRKVASQAGAKASPGLSLQHEAN